MTLELPYPPTVNTYWRSLGRGRVVLSRKGRAYRKAVVSMVKALRGLVDVLIPPEARLRVVLRAYVPDLRRRDLDNIPKGPLDALKHAKVYGDDSQIDDLRIVRCPKVKGGRLVAEIEVIQ